jgi:ABC-type siderophore export system fused ATPase/permease subunit
MNFINRIFSGITSLLKDKGDNLSSTRFAFLLSVIISNIMIFGVWAYLSITSHLMVPFPESVIVIFSLANAITYSGKLYQKTLENKEDTTK